MAHFIKPGLWKEARKAPKEWLNLENLFKLVSISIITNQSTVDISSQKSTITSSDATKTFTISYTGDDMTLEVVLNTTTATYTFPSNSLCVSEGVASGDNTLSLSGTSGDHYIIGIKSVNGTYYVVAKNFGQ